MQTTSRIMFASASILALSIFATSPAASVQPPPETTATEPHDQQADPAEETDLDTDAPVIAEAEEIPSAADQAAEHAEAGQPPAAGGAGAAPVGTPETAPLGSSGTGGTGGNGAPVKDPDKPS